MASFTELTRLSTVVRVVSEVKSITTATLNARTILVGGETRPSQTRAQKIGTHHRIMSKIPCRPFGQM